MSPAGVMDARRAREILRVSLDATEREIKRAFGKRLRKIHPDSNPDSNLPEAEITRRKLELEEARDLLLGLLQQRDAGGQAGQRSSEQTSGEPPQFDPLAIDLQIIERGAAAIRKTVRLRNIPGDIDPNILSDSGSFWNIRSFSGHLNEDGTRDLRIELVIDVQDVELRKLYDELVVMLEDHPVVLPIKCEVVEPTKSSRPEFNPDKVDLGTIRKGAAPKELTVRLRNIPAYISPEIPRLARSFWRVDRRWYEANADGTDDLVVKLEINTQDAEFGNHYDRFVVRLDGAEVVLPICFFVEGASSTKRATGAYASANTTPSVKPSSDPPVTPARSPALAPIIISMITVLVLFAAVQWLSSRLDSDDDGTQSVTSGQDPKIAPPASQRFTQISLNTSYICGIATDQELQCWLPPTLSPLEADDALLSPPIGRFRAVSVNDEYACAVKADGELVCWGDGMAIDPPTPESGDTFVYLDVTNPEAPCAIRSNGSLACWNNAGDLTGNPPTDRGAPVFDFGNSLTSISVIGDREACAVTTSNKLTCTETSLLPWQFEDTDFTTVSAGELWNCAIDASQRASCWRSLNWSDDFEIVQLEGKFTDIEVMSSDSPYVCGVRADSSIFCQGLTPRATLDPDFLEPAPTSPPSDNYVDVELDALYGCGITSEGDVRCWS